MAETSSDDHGTVSNYLRDQVRQTFDGRLPVGVKFDDDSKRACFRTFSIFALAVLATADGGPMNVSHPQSAQDSHYMIRR